MNDIEEALKVIETAFVNTPYPGDSNLVWSHDEVEMEHDFRGEHWRDIPLNLIFTHQMGLAFFTREAFRFYLPAFMRAILLRPNEGYRLSSNLLAHLTPAESLPDRWTKVIRESMMEQLLNQAASFTQIEIAAIITFLETFKQLFKAEYQSLNLKMADHALVFWKTRA